MKVTYNWLKDFVDINIPPQALAQMLTMAGLEVTSQEESGGDRVFEIEITSNRPDWLSIIGIAREVAAITGKKLKLSKSRRPSGSRVSRSTSQSISVSVEDKKDCPLYTATVVAAVKVAASPDWLFKRLEQVGVRPVNNIVDITNYVLFETGQPLHAFDLDKLSDQSIFVRRAKLGEKIFTLDGQEKILDPQALVIADRDKPVAVAGVMGGRDTEVTSATKNILLEAAVFDPVVVRRCRRQLGLQTESSYRFERGVDSGGLEAARSRAVELICSICGGNEVLAKSATAPLKKRKSIEFDPGRTRQVLGASISAKESAKILSRLGFEVRQKRDNMFLVDVPSWRADVKLDVDLLEEVARVYGYNNIPVSLPAIKADVVSVSSVDMTWLVKNILCALGSNEVITYSLVDRRLLECFQPDASGLAEIRDPLSREQEVLRPVLAPSLGRCIGLNLNQKQDYVNIFEISRVFSGSGGKSAPAEKTNLCIGLCGERKMLLESGLVRDKMGLLHLKGMVESLFSRLGIKEYDFSMNAAGSAAITIGQEQIGLMRSLDKKVLDYLDIKNKDVFIAELCLDAVLSAASLKKKFKPLSLYPGINRDISFILPLQVRARDILSMAREKGGVLLRDVRVVDYYAGKPIPHDRKSLTISCLYRSDERTLTENEVTPVHESIRALLKERFGAELR